MRYYLGIDQGGSKTEAVLFTEDGSILSFVNDRDIRQPGDSYAEKQGSWIRLTAERAQRAAGLPQGSLSGACCALNGADWPEDYDRLKQTVAFELSLPESGVIIVNDCVGAMRGGTSSGNCAVLCLGTGMNCAVRSADGREYIYGYFVNPQDQGGGALGSRAWQCILDAFNGFCPPTLLTRLALKRYAQPDLVTLYRGFTQNRIVFRNYDFVPDLMEAAIRQDAAACAILSAAAARMVRYVEEGIRKLEISGTWLTLVLTGGVFKGNGSVFFSMISGEVRKKLLPVRCVEAKYEPAAGAALLMLDRLRGPESEAHERFRGDAGRFGLERLV